MKNFVVENCIKIAFHCTLLTKSQHMFRKWLGVMRLKVDSSHHLNLCLSASPQGITRPQWVNTCLLEMCLNSVHCLLQVDNEENVLVCLRIIIELHKQYRPQINTEVSVMSMVTDTIGVKPLLANDNYHKISNIRRSRLCHIYWRQVLSREWRCSWSSADRRCSNYIWVINDLIAN